MEVKLYLRTLFMSQSIKCWGREERKDGDEARKSRGLLIQSLASYSEECILSKIGSH